MLYLIKHISLTNVSICNTRAINLHRKHIPHVLLATISLSIPNVLILLAGTMCSDGFDDAHASIICRSLGYASGRSNTSFPAGTGPIWMNNIDCLGTESNITGCLFPDWGSNNCNHRQDVGDATVQVSFWYIWLNAIGHQEMWNYVMITNRGNAFFYQYFRTYTHRSITLSWKCINNPGKTTARWFGKWWC